MSDKNGCWTGARSVGLPGVTIGPGAVVATDVAPDTPLGDVPARFIRSLIEPESVGRP